MIQQILSVTFNIPNDEFMLCIVSSSIRCEILGRICTDMFIPHQVLDALGHKQTQVRNNSSRFEFVNIAQK